MNGGERRPRRRLPAASVLAAVAIAVAVALIVRGAGGPSPGRSTSGHTTSTTTARPGPAGHAPPSALLLGASVNILFNDRSYGAATIDAQLHALRQTGATIARSDALWEAVEPDPPAAGRHHYDWAFDDRIAAALAAHHLEWLPIIDYSAPWDKLVPSELHSPPRSPGEYSAYAAAFAARYGLGGSFWTEHPDLPSEPVTTFEIWNEPDDVAFWSPTTDAGRYAELYLSARDAITAVDPTARVIVGGLTHWTSFLPAMLHARPELLGHLDGVAIHPYARTPLGILGGVRSARAVLRSLAMPDVPLYVTEFGWTTSPPGALHYLSARLRPSYIEGTIVALSRSDCEIATIVLYTWVTAERNSRDPGDWFGIHPTAGGGSADSDSFVAALRQAAAPAARVALCGSG